MLDEARAILSGIAVVVVVGLVFLLAVVLFLTFDGPEMLRESVRIAQGA